MRGTYYSLSMRVCIVEQQKHMCRCASVYVLLLLDKQLSLIAFVCVSVFRCRRWDGVDVCAVLRSVWSKVFFIIMYEFFFFSHFFFFFSRQSDIPRLFFAVQQEMRTSVLNGYCFTYVIVVVVVVASHLYISLSVCYLCACVCVCTSFQWALPLQQQKLSQVASNESSSRSSDALTR